jgi:pimeloyl-ACP methyl ester carboxylesterase
MKYAFSALLAAGLAAGASAEPIPIEDFAMEPAITSLSMAPEGDFIVGLVAKPGSDNGELALAVWDIDGEIDTSKPLIPNRITPSNKRARFYSADAIGQGRMLVRSKQAWTGQTYCLEGGGAGALKTFVFKTYYGDKSIDPKKFDSEFANLVDKDDKCAELGDVIGLTSTLPLDPENVLVSSRDMQQGTRKYYKVNLKTEAKTFLYNDAGDLGIGYVDPRDGAVRTKLELEPIGNNDYEIRTYILNPKTGSFDREDPLTYKASKRYQVDIDGYDEATGKYYVLTDLFSDKTEVWMYDPATDKFDDQPAFAHPEFSASGVILGRKVHNWNQPLGFTYDGATRETYWIDPEYRGIVDGLSAVFPGLSIDIMDSNEDLSRVLIRTSASNSPPAYYLLIDKAKLGVLGSSRPWMLKHKLATTKLIYYTARDGLRIPGLLTLPPEWKEGDKPGAAIVLPHGGPWARNYAGWDASGWTQFLSSRGYAVLQPQYRGSEGWGRELWFAGDNEWGQKMQDDKDDAAAWLVSEGIAQKDRMAIFGYSYGGFAAFAATVRENGPFQCAIAGAGVSNLELFRTKVSDNRINRAVQGHTMTGMDPLANADKANIPILIYHGDRDVRVPIRDGRDFYNAVKNRVPAKFLPVKDMFHQMPWWPEHHRETLTAIEDFLANDCGPGGL